MALKVKAVERNLKFSKDDPGIWRYVMQPELYSSLAEGKVIREAALRSGVSEGVMKACWDAAGESEGGRADQLGQHVPDDSPAAGHVLRRERTGNLAGRRRGRLVPSLRIFSLASK